jgi:hypothetical protein
MTYMQAALTILAHVERPLTVPELTAVAVADGLVRPRGLTPDRTMSSVLYRRMAADPDAPIINRAGRFWLRERPLPETEPATYRARTARHTRPFARRGASGPSETTPRRATTLPPPPLRLSSDVLRAVAAASGDRATGYAPTRRERAVTRAGARGARLLERLAARRARPDAWDLAATDSRLVAPLLAHLGYRHGAGLTPSDYHGQGRGLRAYTLSDDSGPLVTLHVRRVAHDLDDDDAWRALGHAHEIGAAYAAVTNGCELRLYAVVVAEARDDANTALVLALDIAPVSSDDPAYAGQAAALWLLRRDSIGGGALDAYATNKVIGAVLTSALDAPDSPLARALVAEARARLGVALPAALITRHARLALRERRGRDGEPMPEDVATVAAVRGPRLRPAPVTVARSA